MIVTLTWHAPERTIFAPDALRHRLGTRIADLGVLRDALVAEDGRSVLLSVEVDPEHRISIAGA